MLWLGGGMSQIDTFDPKPLGDAKIKKAGGYYESIDTSVPGVQVCQHLKKTAKLMEHLTAVRFLHHDVVDEHAAATNRMHTGRPTSGTVTYPSLGSIVAHKRGAAADGVPSYAVLGYPNIVRGPGFLGPEAGFIYTTDLKSGPAGLARPKWLSTFRNSRRQELLEKVRKGGKQRFPKDEKFSEYDAALQESIRLSGPEFMKTFNLESEPADFGAFLRQRIRTALPFGETPFPVGCSIRGSFLQRQFQNGTGWDTHNAGQLKQHLLIEDLDDALSSLILDLKNHHLLEKTVILINSEFGRPGGFDSGGGRGHQSKCFTNVIAGGGLNHRGAYGLSNEVSEKIVENPVSVPDFFATALTALQVDPSEYLYDGDRPVPITDGGKAIPALL